MCFTRHRITLCTFEISAVKTVSRIFLGTVSLLLLVILKEWIRSYNTVHVVNEFDSPSLQVPL